jgi:SAM-dependent methyltransferase
MAARVRSPGALAGDLRRTLEWARQYGPLRGLDVRRPLVMAAAWARFARDWRRYRRLPGAETLRLTDSWPRLFDGTSTTEFDAHYFYQGVWTGGLVARHSPAHHVDVGSDHRVVAMLSCFIPTTFVDIRPLPARAPGLRMVAGDITRLPFRDDSLGSLSCLHVVEHVGLGRYGDPLDPHGTQRAIAELARVLEPGGHLYLSTPVGRGRVQFNGQRVHTPRQIQAYAQGLELVEFAAVGDDFVFRTGVEPSFAERARHACGMFWLRKPR